MIDKTKIKDSVIKDLEREILECERSVETAKSDMMDAEGPMLTRYDTRRHELGTLADAQYLRLQELKDSLREIQNFELFPTEQVMVGSYVMTMDEKDVSTHYMVLPCAGGTKVKHDDNNITILSVKSPLYHAMRGKKEGDDVEFRGKEVYIEKLV